MNYPEALQYLDRFINYEQAVAFRYPEAFSLDRIAALLRRLGNPERDFPVLHVAGTKGKGSTCAFAASLLSAAGLKVGLYTSPHLASLRERFRVGGCPISEEKFAEVVSRIKPFAKKDLTYFEVTTACAFSYFADLKVDAAVIEVGLGGRLDATNVVRPDVTAITPISLDHMDKLGFSLGRIAHEKAGIIKPDVPVVVARQTAEVTALFEAAALNQQAPLHRLEEQARIRCLSLTPQGCRFFLETPKQLYSDLSIPLLGRHQVDNAAVAVRMVELFAEAHPEKLQVTPEVVRNGLSRVVWPGRCQWIAGKPSILLDGAQNRASAQALRETVDTLFPGQKVSLIFGASQGKDIRGMAEIWGPWADRILVTQTQSPRAESSAHLKEIFAGRGIHAESAPSIASALETAQQKAAAKDLIVIAGSLFVAGEVLKLLGPRTAASSCGVE